MTCRGRVQNGVVVPEAGTVLPEGAEVRIDITAQPTPPGTPDESQISRGEASPQSMYERYKDIIGVIKDLPPDASERVDDLLYGSSSL
jgi:hypothetical protein